MLRSETAEDPARAAAALAGLRAYQGAPRTPPLPPMPVVARAGRAVVRDYGGGGRPVLFVPSLINPPDILDLDAERSLLRWLATQGLRPLLLDWGSPDPAARNLDMGGHVETMLLPLIEALGEGLALAGYCLGGTMALATAALRPVERLVLIAAPWHFGRYPAETSQALTALWAAARPGVEAMGLMPMEVLQTAFWRLDPGRTVAKFVAFGSGGAAAPGADAFVRLEDWANDGPPLTEAAARELLADFYAADLPGRGLWRVGGQTVDPAAITSPVLEIVSTTDRIVPAAVSAGLGERIELAYGHVGMIVGRRARPTLWEPLARWLSR